jgi:radical SAM superfamily enzyme YgiQ (UPF0313 family)
MNFTQPQNKHTNQERILLMTLPFLTPLIPPMGISCLKSFLQKNGYYVKTIDVMAEMPIRELCYLYFDTLEGHIPDVKRGHYFNVALDVLFNHFMAHFNHTDENKYIELVRLLVYRNFYVSIDNREVQKLNEIVAEFYIKLEGYLIRQIGKEKPGILGLSVYKGTLASSLFAARLVKLRWPEIKILMGGTIFSQELFPLTPNFNSFLERAPYIDKIFIGESEQLLLQYLRGRLSGDKKVYTLEDIKNELVNLDSLEIPDFSDFDLSSYPLLPAYTSRGCIYQCSFCAETVFWKRYNRKSVEKVADELDRLSQEYRKNIFLLTDCLINPLVTDLSSELIKRRLKIYWDVYIKVDKHTCDAEYTTLWRRGGFYRARLGIETASQRLLNIIDKRITIEQIKLSLKSLASAGIKTTTYWIAGHPGETEEDFQQTLDLLEEMQDYIFEAECDPFRFFYKGQVNTNTNIWNNKSLLYPEDDTNMLLTQTYVLNEKPSRKLIYERECRFKEYCKKLGIPNPYSIAEIREADKRWSILHKTAVPPLLELAQNYKDTYISKEKKQIHLLQASENPAEDDVDFNFYWVKR